MTITTTKVEDFFAKIKDKDIESYNDYWGELKPQSKNAVFRRYLFAFMSVHTTWENNCRGYNAIKKFNDWSLEKTDQLQLWNYNADKLFDFIKTTRVGLQNNRTNFIGTFYDKFLDDPSDYISRSDSETWTQWRDRLAKKILGLGKAKTSFAIEMLFPLEAQVVCMDTHLFQIYGLNQTKHAKLYNEIEGDWLNRSKERGLAPYMARCLYWDKNQNRKNSRYWSKVLEK
jgi:hypothetical protein